MDGEDELPAPTNSDEVASGSPQRSSSLSFSQDSPSLPAEGDWLEAEDLDGDRWVKAEDIDNMWGEAAVPAFPSNRVNNIQSFPDSANLGTHAFHATQPPAVDLNMHARPGAAAMPEEDKIKASEPSPKRARLSTSPSPFKSSPHTHHTVIPVKLSPDLPDLELSSSHPSKEETLFTDAAPGSVVDSEDDTGSSGDVSASLRQLHAASTDNASSPHSEGMAGSASGDDMLGSQEDQASSHDYDTDDGSESSDGFGGTPLHICVNCTNRMCVGDVICLDCGHEPAQDDELFNHQLSSQPVAPPAQRVMLAYDERMTLHVEGRWSTHPERPDRIRAVMACLTASGLTDQCLPLRAREATAAEIAACHGPHHMTRVANKTALAAADAMAGGPGRAHFSCDTYVNQHTLLCARLAAGTCADVATAVVRQEASTGVAIVRPPGHHAESNTVMGFCFFNNSAIAARAAQAAGAERVLILDWDVHHGNGTQEIFASDPSVMYMSIHRHDRGRFYPGTGAAEATGTGSGQGFSVNVPWLEGEMGNGDYMAAFQHVLLPIAYQFNPSLIIISAGFDAAVGDPIGGCKVTEECFAHMTAMLQPIAPLAVLLEGGYNLSATAAATEACLRVLLGQRPPPLPLEDRAPSASGLAVIQHVIRTQAQHWTCLRGLVPMPAPSLSGVDHRLFPKLNTLPATNHVSVAAQQQYVQEPQQSPSQAAMITDDSHVHGAACHLSGQGLENDGQDGKHAYEADQHTAWSHSAPGPELNIHGSHKAHDLNSWQDHKVATPPAESQAVHKSRGSSAVGTVSDSAVMRADQSVSTSTRQVSDDQVCAEHVASPADSSPRAHAHVADDSSQHGHRLLADGQDTHAHAAKAVHRTKQASHMCQGKSHQRLLLMTALHVSAQKQMKRQHKHAHAGHVRRQKSI